MMRKIHLHGYLADLVQRPVYLEADTVAEAINGLCKVTGRALQPNAKTGRHAVKVVGFETAESLVERTDVEELHVVPAFFGGKDGIFQVVLGAVIIAVAVVASGGTGLVAAGALTAWGQVALAGAMLALGGLIQMMSPAPKMDLSGNSVADPEASKYLGATQNTVKIGTRIPILVGRFVVPGQYLSFNVDAKDVAV